MCCTRLAGNAGAKKSPKICHLRTIAQLCRAIFFTTKTCIDNWKKPVKQQYLLQMSSQYSKLPPTNGWALLVGLGHPSKFQRVSHLGFVTAPTSLIGGQPNFARCLATSWAGTLYIHFRGLCPMMEFCYVQNSLCIEVLHSPILAALLHRTAAAGVSQPLQRGTRNGITHLYSAGQPWRWASAHILVV